MPTFTEARGCILYDAQQIFGFDYWVPRTIPISVTSAPAEFRIELG
jgi:hypothetical protein